MHIFLKFHSRIIFVAIVNTDGKRRILSEGINNRLVSDCSYLERSNINNYKHCDANIIIKYTSKLTNYIDRH